MCDCITNAFYLMIILVSGDSLDIKELTNAVIIIIFYILIGFEHIYCRHLYIFMCIKHRVRDQRCAYSLNVLLYID